MAAHTVLSAIIKRRQGVEKNTNLAKSKRDEALNNLKKMEKAILEIIKNISTDGQHAEVA